MIWGVALGILAVAAQVGLALHMWATFLIAAAFLVGYIVRRKLVVLGASTAWFVEGAWEYLLRALMDPQEYADFNIRLDLLVIIPVVVALSAAAGKALFSRQMQAPGAARES